MNLDIPVELIDNASHEINYENLNGKILIGLMGYAKSGKDTIAKTMVNRLGFKRLSFADTLKEDLNDFFKPSVWEDLTNKGIEIEFQDIDFLNPSTPELKEILRPYMIWFGEKMKELNGSHHWTNRAFSKIEESDHKLVITDVRRINELEIFKNNKEFQKIRNKNREEIGLDISSFYQIDAKFDSLLFFVNQIHNRDFDYLTQQTLLKAIEDWLINDNIFIDSRIQNIGDYHQKHILMQIFELAKKYPTYFI
jgi:hypothetical protein